MKNKRVENLALYLQNHFVLKVVQGQNKIGRRVVQVWMQVDPKAEYLYGMSPYNSMGNNPISYSDPNGDFIPALLIGAAIGAGISGATTIATNAIAGNNLFQGFGKALAFGAVGGAIGAGVGAAFAGTSFGQSTGLGILNNVASNAATSAAFGQDITLGSLAGSVAGGVLSGQLPQFSGVKGGSLLNGLAEIGHKSLSGAVTGGIGGGIGAVIDGGNVGTGFLNGAKHGAIGGGVQAGLNILTMGTAYVPDDPNAYGDFGRFKPVYRRGSIFTPYGGGIALGRNLVTGRTGDNDYDHYLRAHETGHFDQQRKMGFGKFYGRTAREYLRHGLGNVYGTSGTLEFLADRYSLNQIGYYYHNGRQTKY